MQDQILDMLVKEDEITWYTIIMDLIRTEQMDPWDIDISILANKYIETIKKLKEANLSISGKVLLASAILLKIKSTKLVDEDLMNLDRMMHFDEENDDFEEDMGGDGNDSLIPIKVPKHFLLPRVPQPRKRKVSIYDLIDALQKALNVTKRRAVREILENIHVHTPGRKFDINEMLDKVFEKVTVFYSSKNEEKNTLKFSKLIGSESKEDVVHTLIPLLHLSNMRKVDLEQEGLFTDIDIIMVDQKKIGESRPGKYEKEQKQIKLQKRRLKKKGEEEMKKDEKNADEKEESDVEEEKEVAPFISNVQPSAELGGDPDVMTDESGEPMLVSEVYDTPDVKDKEEESEKADYIQ